MITENKAEKKLILDNPWVKTAVYAALFISCVFAAAFESRGLNLLLGGYGGMPYALLYTVGGLVRFVLFILLSRFILGFIRNRRAREYALAGAAFFAACGNAALALFKLTYIITPLISVFGETFVSFFIFTAFMAGFAAWFLRTRTEKEAYAPVLTRLAGMYFFISAAYILFGLAGGLL